MTESDIILDRDHTTPRGVFGVRWPEGCGTTLATVSGFLFLLLLVMFGPWFLELYHRQPFVVDDVGDIDDRSPTESVTRVVVKNIQPDYAGEWKHVSNYRSIDLISGNLDAAFVRASLSGRELDSVRLAKHLHVPESAWSEFRGLAIRRLSVSVDLETIESARALAQVGFTETMLLQLPRTDWKRKLELLSESGSIRFLLIEGAESLSEEERDAIRSMFSRAGPSVSFY